MTSLQWVQTISSLVVQTTLVVLATWMLEKSIRTSRIRVRLWTSCYLSIIGLVVASLLLPRLQLIHPWSSFKPASLVSIARAENTVGTSMIVVWMLGIFIILFRWVMNHFQFRWLMQRCEPFPPDKQKIIVGIVEQHLLNVAGARVEFRRGPDHLGPFCYQLHNPIVFLPESLFEGDLNDLKNVLVHELTHLQSRHAMQLFLENLVQAALWFQPLVWLSAQRAALVREFECDDASSGDRQATIGYLKTLIRIVETRPPAHSGTLPIGHTITQLKVRAARLVNRDEQEKVRSNRLLTLIPLATAIVFSQCWLPTNPLASPTSRWSAWPTWSASVLHELDIPARDFEPFDPRIDLYELLKRKGND